MSAQKTIVDKIKPTEISQEMKDSYLDYAMSVIISRALPDVRDGLKPVHRRILFSMYNLGLKHSAKFRKSATVVGECFAKDTFILANNKGLVPIQEIKCGDKVFTQNGVKKVERLYEMPPRELLRVGLENGIYNTVTPSQKFKIINEKLKFEWKEAKHLTRDDYIAVKACFPEIKTSPRLKSNRLNQPRFLNKGIAYLLGEWLSDGWITEDYSKKKFPRLGFCSSSRKVLEKIADILRKEFHYSPILETRRRKFKNKKGNSRESILYILRINNKEINEFFISNFHLKGQKALNKEIPSQIFASSSQIIFAFISGLIEGDGNISVKRHRIQYATISSELSSKLLLLLQHLGIFGNRYEATNKSKGGFINGREIWGRHKVYSVEFNGLNATLLAQKLNLIDEKKRQKLHRIRKRKARRNLGWFNHDIVPYSGKNLFKELSRLHLGSGWYKSTNDEKFRMGIKYPAGCKIRYSKDLKEKPLRKGQIIDWGIQTKLALLSSPHAQFLTEIIDNKIYFIKVRSIKKVSSQRTYDFEVADDHEFVANGMIAHNCLGKFHPHGDIAVYDALARMAQDFSLRYLLIDGQGNWGSIDGDMQAAMRYTECKLKPLAEEMLFDIEKETVDFVSNYDGTRKEPTVLPAKVPQLLINGTMGIAVGMATNIPPHNLGEVIDGLILLIDEPTATIEDLSKFIQGPDFPTGGAVYNFQDIIQAYATGRGGIVTRAQTKIEKDKIIVTEIPYQVNKATLVEKIADLVKAKRIEGIKDIRDESSRQGIRIVIELAKDSHSQKILNQLFSLTDLQKTFHLNMLALVDGIQPRVLSLKEILEEHLRHRQEVITRRSQFLLKQAKTRSHILEGLKIALSQIDAVIKVIKQSQTKEIAQKNLIEKFNLTKIQAEAILEMKLSALARLEQEKIINELKEKLNLIQELEAILKEPKKILEIIKKELAELKQKYSDSRRTKVFRGSVKAFAEEDLVPNEQTIITITKGGYIKRLSPQIYRRQKRGGKGIVGMTTKGEDIVEHFLFTMTHDSLLFFTSVGRVFQTKAFEIPEASRIARGKALVNFLSLAAEEKVTAIIPLKKSQQGILVMATKNGIIKKTPLKNFEKVRRTGLIAIKLKKGDELRWVKASSGQDEIMLVTCLGQSIRFRETDVRSMGRSAAGVRGIKLKKDDRVIGMEIISNLKITPSETRLRRKQISNLLVISENGYGKRTNLDLYKVQRRGGKGIKTANITKKTGHLISSKIIGEKEKDLIIISEKGQVIRIPITDVSKMGRSTQGVRIMKLIEGDKVASVTCI